MEDCLKCQNSPSLNIVKTITKQQVDITAYFLISSPVDDMCRSETEFT